MLTPENLLLVIVIGFLLLNIQTIASAIILLFQNLREVTIEPVAESDVPEETYTIVKPYQELLKSKGFEQHYTYQYQNMLEKFETTQYGFYFYHPEKSVHAFVYTTPMPGCLQALTIEYTTIYENYNVVSTYDCFGHNMKAFESTSIFDHYHGSFEKAFESHLQDRHSETAEILTEPFNHEGCLSFIQHQTDASINAMLEENIMKTTQHGYKFNMSVPFFKHIHQSVKGYKRSAKALTLAKQTSSETLNTQTTQHFYKNSEMLALEQQLDEKPTPASREQKIRTFIVSGLAFVLVFGLIGIPWVLLPALLVILVIHELGHYYTMKFFGYQDTSIFFIPFFGAAAKGEKEHLRPFEEYIILLAGPLPGILIGIGIFIATLYNPELRSEAWLQQLALFFLIINYFNLLPIYPLDGGKIVQSLLFTHYPKMQFYFFLFSLFLIIMAALALESILLGLFGLLLFFNINQSHKTSILIQNIMREKSDTPVKQRILENLSNNQTFKEIPLVKKALMAKQALKILNTEKPSVLLSILGIGFYLVLLLLPFIGIPLLG
jgi:Zn-dependent protease